MSVLLQQSLVLLPAVELVVSAFVSVVVVSEVVASRVVVVQC